MHTASAKAEHKREKETHMGDRANIVIRQGSDAPVYLYGHWSGAEVCDVVRRSLSKRWRWDDPSYLARIIACELWKGHEETETGFGIWTAETDNEHLFVVVNVDAKRVELRKFVDKGEPQAAWTFDEFAALSFPKMADPEEVAKLATVKA